MRPSSYRWIILSVFMFITLAVEIQWLTHAAVARPAEIFYKGQFDPASFLNIDFMAMLYMLLFLLMSFPASYIIDTYGIKRALRLGAVLVGVSGICKAIFASSFIGVVISQVGLAIAQPFILNAVTAVSVRWFPLAERGMAAGLSALAQYAGMVPGVFGLGFADNLELNENNTYILLLVSSFTVGFFVMSAGPIGFQYAAEVSYPAPESASQGMLLWVGQLSGMLFVSLMSVNNNQHLSFFLAVFAVLTLFALAGVLFLRESPMIRNEIK